MTEYPYYIVEGRRFSAEESRLAVYFARHMANQMGRPVSLIRALDHMTPDAVIYTAEPEADHEGQEGTEHRNLEGRERDAAQSAERR